MKTSGSPLFVVTVSAALLFACEEQKPAPASSPSGGNGAAPAPALTATTTSPTTTPTAASTGGKATERPAKVDTELTLTKRTAVEAKYPAAKGFVVASEIEAKLKADKTLKDKKAGLAAFDRAARGKWVLFTGPIVNLTDDGFDLVVVYTPQLPNDPMGMSRQFFEVTMTKVEGYSKDDFKTGTMGVVLVKYAGGAKASPGYELVATDAWN